MTTESLRLRATTIAEYKAQASRRGLHHSALMREALEAYVEQRRLRRLALPPMVPEVNREAWVELRAVAADLHRIARAVETSRTDALVVAARRAARSAAWLVNRLKAVADVSPDIHKLLHKVKAEPGHLADAVKDARQDAQALNAAVHDHLRTLPEQISPELLEQTRLHVQQAMAAVRGLGLQLLGSRDSGTPA